MRLALSLAAVLLLFGLSGGSWHLWSHDLPALIPSGRFLIIPSFIILLCSVGRASITHRRPLVTLNDFTHPVVWCGGLLTLVISDWLCRPYALYQGPTIRGELLLGAALMWILTKKGWKQALQLLPIGASILAIWSFFLRAHGNLLFSDDHAMFLFRLKLLKENFPFIPFWFPMWNGGIDARDFFATGALNAFLLASPLVYTFPVEKVYNLIIALFLWGLVPFSSYLTARKLGSEKTVGCVAALLAMSPALVWYRWTLKYGTVGFMVSAALVPLVLALSIRFISERNLSWRLATAFILTSTLMLLWSPSGMALAPLALIALPRCKWILLSRRHVITLLVLIALNLPWMAMMWKVSGVGKFLKSENTATTHQTVELATSAQPQKTEQPASTYRHRAGGLNLKASKARWQEGALSLNPVIFVLALPALIALPAAIRGTYLLVTGWLLFLGTFGVSLKPQLELDRMLVIGALVLCYPVAQFIVSVFTRAQESRAMRLSAVTVGSFLLIAPFTVTSIVMNRSYEQYFFASPGIKDLASTIEQNARGGRALFSGCVLHELSGGHLAPLPFWAKTPLIASSYAHNIWRYEQPIPKSFLEREDEGIRQFFNLMNVTMVTAHEPHWRKYFGERTTEYKEIGRHEGFILYARLNTLPSYVIQGSAKDLEQTTNSLRLTPESERIVLSFKYYPFIRSSQCAVAPFVASPELTLIELTGCRIGEPVILESINPLERLLR
jgi:hypothetical protein